MLDLTPQQTEAERVEAWRLNECLNAGLPLPVAERFAGSDADLHKLVGLIRRGCPPLTAARILI